MYQSRFQNTIFVDLRGGAARPSFVTASTFSKQDISGISREQEFYAVVHQECTPSSMPRNTEMHAS